MLTFLRIERPTSATLRPSAQAASITCWTRWMLEAKLVTTIRPGGPGEHLLEVRAHAALGGREAGPVGVGGVAAEQQHPVAAQLGQARDVGRRPVHGGLVELVVAGHEHRARLGCDGDRARVGNRVGHVDHLHAERPQLELLARSTSSRGTSRRRCSSSFERAIATVSGPPKRDLLAELAQDPRAAPRGGPRGRG